MDPGPVISCRGCMKEVKPHELYSFTWPEVKQLFLECTYISVPPEEDHSLPQQICLECMDFCHRWFQFKEMCQQVNQQLLTSIPIPEPQPAAEEVIPTFIRIKDEPIWEDDYMGCNQDSIDFDACTFGQLIADPGPMPSVVVERLDERQIAQLIASCKTGKQVTCGWKCPVCSSMVSDFDDLKDHLKQHYTEENPKCPICSKSFNRGSKIYSHVISKHMDETAKRAPLTISPNKPAKSSKCLPIKEEVQEDVRVEVQETPKPLKCPICKKMCPELYVHIYKTHTKRGDPKCPLCDRVYESRTSVKHHLLSHTGEKPFPCSLCRSSFTQLPNLRIHLKNIHQMKKKEVQKHVSIKEEPETTPVKKKQSTVVKEEPIKSSEKVCPICGQPCRTKQHLKNHLVVHTDERPYKCIHCKKDYRNKDVAKIHVRAHHPHHDVETSVIVKRGSIFRMKNPWEALSSTLQEGGDKSPKKAIKVEIRPSHSRAAPPSPAMVEIKRERLIRIKSEPEDNESLFPCSYCGKQFMKRGSLKRHIANHHDEDDEDEESIDSGFVAFD